LEAQFVWTATTNLEVDPQLFIRKTSRLARNKKRGARSQRTPGAAQFTKRSTRYRRCEGRPADGPRVQRAERFSRDAISDSFGRSARSFRKTPLSITSSAVQYLRPHRERSRNL